MERSGDKGSHATAPPHFIHEQPSHNKEWIFINYVIWTAIDLLLELLTARVYSISESAKLPKSARSMKCKSSF